jgi:hypothetical protein
LDNATSGAPELIAGEDRAGGVNGAKETLPPAELALRGRGGELQDLTYLSVDQANGGLSWMNGCGNTATVQRERDSILIAIGRSGEWWSLVDERTQKYSNGSEREGLDPYSADP